MNQISKRQLYEFADGFVINDRFSWHNSPPSPWKNPRPIIIIHGDPLLPSTLRFLVTRNHPLSSQRFLLLERKPALQRGGRREIRWSIKIHLFVLATFGESHEGDGSVELIFVVARKKREREGEKVAGCTYKAGTHKGLGGCTTTYMEI